MNSYRRSSRTNVSCPCSRPGFTLLELMVVVALLMIVTLMAFSGFRYMTAVMNKSTSTNGIRENLTVVMDQLTKELREVTTVTTDTTTINDGSRLNYGVTLPTQTSASDSSGGLGSVISAPATSPASPTTLAPIAPALAAGQTYTFRININAQPNGIILEFFTIDSASVKHRIRYSLTAPRIGSAYAGVSQQYWADSRYEPCQVTYCNNTWVSTDEGVTYHWTTEQPQPMTDQVVTGFTVTRPSWSPNVLQITLEAQVRSLSGTGYSTVRLVGLATVRQ
jgi:prepilin-type N-terminal cleavage/methylation domain-containing protein